MPTPPDAPARAAGDADPHLHRFEHPLLQDRLSRLRDKRTGPSAFRRHMAEIGTLMAVEMTRRLPLSPVPVETPLARCDAPALAAREPALVPILRAGLGLLEGFRAVLPAAPIGHIGLGRDPETHRARGYYCKLPPADGRDFFLLDPMLATGNSALHALRLLRAHGLVPDRLHLAALVAAPEGIAALRAQFPTLPLHVAAVDWHLDARAYIVPGLGDAGDRLFGTG